MTRPNQYFSVVAAVVGILLFLAIIVHPGIPGDGKSMLPTSTQPASTQDSPPELAILAGHNIFANAKARAAAAKAGGAESNLVFRGGVQTGEDVTAFVEDMAAKRVLQLAVGAAVGRGVVKAIDLDMMEYQVGKATHKISIGQNLNGENAPPPAPPATGPSPQGGPPAGGPPNGPQGRPPRGMPPGAMPPGMPPGATLSMPDGN